MAPLIALLLLTRHASQDIARVNLPQRIFSITPVGPSNSHFVVVQALESIANKNENPKTEFFLVDALSRKVTPLPGGLALANQQKGATVDMRMSDREVWRVSLSDPSSKTVVRTKHDMQSICFNGDSAEGYYVSAKSQKSPSKLVHLLGNGGEQTIHLSAGEPLGVLYCLPGRCLVQFDDDVDNEGAQHSHMAWISTATGRQIGTPSGTDALPVAGRADPICLSGGLVWGFVEPAIAHDSIGGPKLEVFKIRDLALGKVVGKVKVPYPDGQNAGMGISCSDASKTCLFCRETLVVNPTVDKDGLTRSNARFQRRYYRYRVGTGAATSLYKDSIPDLSAGADNEWSTACALTNDGHYLVVTGRNDGELQIISVQS